MAPHWKKPHGGVTWDLVGQMALLSGEGNQPPDSRGPGHPAVAMGNRK